MLKAFHSACRYAVSYAEHSSIAGTLKRDAFWLTPKSNAPPQIVFGCQTRETGQIYTQKADGILGLASSPVALPSQLVAMGTVPPRFTLCFGMTSGVRI